MRLSWEDRNQVSRSGGFQEEHRSLSRSVRATSGKAPAILRRERERLSKNRIGEVFGISGLGGSLEALWSLIGVSLGLFDGSWSSWAVLRVSACSVYSGGWREGR